MIELTLENFGIAEKEDLYEKRCAACVELLYSDMEEIFAYVSKINYIHLGNIKYFYIMQNL